MRIKEQETRLTLHEHDDDDDDDDDDDYDDDDDEIWKNFELIKVARETKVVSKIQEGYVVKNSNLRSY